MTVIMKDNENELQILPSGRENISETNKNETDKINNQYIVSFTKDVLPYIIPLTWIL